MPAGIADGRELPGFAAPEPTAEERALAHIEHTERVADLQTLKPRERRELYLQALGYRYSEIDTPKSSTSPDSSRPSSVSRCELIYSPSSRGGEDL